LQSIERLELRFYRLLIRGNIFLRGEEDPKAGIYVYNVSAGITSLHKLETVGFPKNEPLNPHGISFWENLEGQKFLFVVNHRGYAGKDYVDIFEYKEDKLFYTNGYTNPLFLSLNDLVAVGPNSFYTTNDHMTVRYAPYNFLEEFFQIYGTTVVYFHENEARIVASNLCFANGINVSPDGKKIYVTEANAMNLRIFDRDLSTGDLTLAKNSTIYMNTGVDNIDVDGNELVIGAHPNLIKFLLNVMAGYPSPSHAVRVTLDEDNKATLEDLYLDDGTFISLSSVAILYNKKLLIGTAFDGPFVVCE